MAKRFQFQLQPALDKAVAEEEKAQQALRAARDELKSAEARLEELKGIVEKTRQQIKAEHDNLIRPKDRPDSALAFLQRDEFIRALRLREASEQQAVVDQQTEVSWCRERVEIRRQEANEATMRVKAMEKLREKALEEFRKEEERRLQNDIDEAGIQRAARQQ
jgi:flagellar FliJ protein